MSLAERVLTGDRRAAARLLRAVDDDLPIAEEALRTLFPHTGKAHVIGITGTPGAGKSTLSDRLISAWRAAGRRVGVLAVDPSSPFTGGAILGDRIRMQQHALDTNVFIRSLATRGSLGGLSRSTFDSVKVLDALGCDVVLIETVGVGQDEVEVAQLAHTTIVVTVPGLGDDVQAIKAGILEIADIFVVNKADREGADRTLRDLRMLLELRRPASHDEAAKVWEAPLVPCVATSGQGIPELVAAIERHRARLDTTGERQRREAVRASTELLRRLQARLTARAIRTLEADGASLAQIGERVARHELDPYAIAEKTLAAMCRPEAA